MKQVSVFSAGERESSLAMAAFVEATNTIRVNQETAVLVVSDPLAAQVRAVQVDGVWPAAAAGEGNEFIKVAHPQGEYHLKTVAASDLRLHRTCLKQLLGDINVLVLHAKYYLPVARFLPLARAVYLQNVLGLTASEALYEALAQIYDITREQLRSDRPKFVERIDNLSGAKWSIELTRHTPAERYPLLGINPRELQPLFRELDDLIVVACRRVAPEQKLLSEVLNESSAPLIVVFAGDEELAFAPGLSIDWLKVAQAIVAPRPGVTYIAEPLVDLRLANDGETLSHLEGLNPQAGHMIWSAILAQRPARQPLAPAFRSVSPTWLVAGAIILPLLLLCMAIFGGFVAAVATVGLAFVMAAEAAMIYGASTQPVGSAASPPAAIPAQAAPVAEVAPMAASSVATERRQPSSARMNGHAHAN